MERKLGRAHVVVDSRGREAGRLSRGADVARGVLRFLIAAGIFGSVISLGGLEWQRRTNEAAISNFATSMAVKLRDPLHNLAAGEKFYPSVTVFLAGIDSNDQLAVQQSGIPLKIRNYPQIGSPGDFKGKVIGEIAQGKEIFNVVVMEGFPSLAYNPDPWAVYECNNAQGAIWEAGKKPEPGSFCASNALNLIASQ